MSPTAGWFPDPYGRFQQRYFDGSLWTAHVFGNDVQQIDPLGNTPSIPFVAPLPGPVTGGPASPQAAIASTTAPTAATGLSTFLDALGPDARIRPTVQLSVALAGVGGAAAAAGIAAAIIGDGGGRARNTIATTVVVVLAYAVRLGVKSQPELRSAAVGAAIIGIPGFAGSVADGGDGGGALSLMAIMLVAAWALPGMRGRPLMLGLGAVAVVLAIITVGESTTSDVELFDFGPADVIGGYAWLFAFAAVAFLAMVWWLDSRGYHGVGTSLVAGTILATSLAVVKVVQDLGSTGAALLLVVVGLAVAAVGDHGQRRASTWFGVGVAAIGTIAFFFSALEPSSVGDTSATLIVSGLLLAIAPIVLQRIRASRRQTEV